MICPIPASFASFVWRFSLYGNAISSHSFHVKQLGGDDRIRSSPMEILLSWTPVVDLGIARSVSGIPTCYWHQIGSLIVLKGA